MTQCAVEERLNLRLAIQGLVTYAETLSVYGTEAVFVDGDDTPWSKAFLASAYASRGVKVRFTSGGGSEALMGESEGKSMLYLEARCLALVRAAGSQGVQNGSISCVALALSVPGGTREVLAENVLAAWLDLEVASGNDAIASHSEIRKTAKLMGQFLPGTDFVTSGYSSMPRYDNMFGGGNYDSHDYDEWLTMQRDWQVDAGIEPLAEEAALAVRDARRAGGAGGVRGARLPADQRRGGRARGDVPRLARPAGPRPRGGRPRRRPRARGGNQRARRRADRSRRRGFDDVAAAVFDMQRQRVAADYLQTSAIIEPDGTVVSAVNDPNDYRGPGTGYRLEGERWERLRRLPYAIDARLLGAAAASEPQLRERGEALRSTRRTRSWSRSAPRSAARSARRSTASARDVLAAHPRRHPRGGRRAAGRARPPLGRRRVHRPRRRAASRARGIAVGLQSKGTALIHRADLQPLDNLELFGMAPSLTLDSYRQIGVNAAGYALGRPVAPVPTVLDNYARAKLIVRTTLLHAREAAEVVRGAPPVELELARDFGADEPPQPASSQGLPSRPQRWASWPSTITHVCSFSSGASSVSSSVSVRRSISCDSSSGVSRRSNSSTRTSGISALHVRRAAVGAEHEVEVRVRDVVERHRRERLHERDAVLREELVVQAAVDDDDVAGAQRRRVVLDRHLDLAVEDEHHLLGVVVLVPRHLLAGRVLDAAEQHLLAADRVQPHAVDELPRVAPVPGAERPRLRGSQASTPKNPSPPFDETVASGDVLVEDDPLAVAPRLRFAASAASTRSGVAGISVIHTPTAS